MLKNNSVDGAVREKLAKIYDIKPIKSLARMVDKWVATSFGVEVLGNGASLGIERSENPYSWIERTNILEDILLEYLDDSKYFIVIDELDEDYRSFDSDEEKISYIYLLTSLFKAVQDIKSIFNASFPGICPVVFLRNDIYSLIKDSDKSKWADFRVDIEWDIEAIKKMLANRISVAVDESANLSFPIAWGKLFDSSIRNSFFKITDSTHLRPRDYVKYIQECAAHALQEKHILMIIHLKWLFLFPKCPIVCLIFWLGILPASGTSRFRL